MNAFGGFTITCDVCRRTTTERYTCFECSSTGNAYNLCEICVGRHDKKHFVVHRPSADISRSSTEAPRRHVEDESFAARCDSCKKLIVLSERHTCYECSPSGTTYDLCNQCISRHDKDHWIMYMLPPDTYSSIDTIKQDLANGTIAARCDNCRRLMAQQGRYTCCDCSPSDDTHDLCGICLPNHNKQHRILDPAVRYQDDSEKNKKNLKDLKKLAKLASTGYALYTTGDLIREALKDGVITQTELIDIGSKIAGIFLPIGKVNRVYNVYETVRTGNLSELNDSVKENLTSVGVIDAQSDNTTIFDFTSFATETDTEGLGEATGFFSEIVTAVFERF